VEKYETERTEAALIFDEPARKTIQEFNALVDTCSRDELRKIVCDKSTARYLTRLLLNSRDGID